MAKTSSVEKNNRRAKMAKQYAGQARQAEGDGGGRQAAAGGALRRARSSSPSCRATPRRRAFAIAARSPGRPRGSLPQVQAVAHRAARAGLVGPSARRGEVELVTGDRDHVDDRSPRRFADPHPQRPAARLDSVTVAGLEAAVERPRCAEARGLHPRLVRGGAAAGREGASRRAEVRRRRAGDQGDQARLQARAAASIRRSRELPRDYQRARHLDPVHAARRHVATPRRAPPMSAAKSSAGVLRNAMSRVGKYPVADPARASRSTLAGPGISRPRASSASCSSPCTTMSRSRVDGRQASTVKPRSDEPPRAHAVGHHAQPGRATWCSGVSAGFTINLEINGVGYRAAVAGQEPEAAARLQPRRRRTRFPAGIKIKLRSRPRSRSAAPTASGSARSRPRSAPSVRPSPTRARASSTRRDDPPQGRQEEVEARPCQTRNALFAPPPAARALPAAPGRRRPPAPHRVPLGQAHLCPGHRRRARA